MLSRFNRRTMIKTALLLPLILLSQSLLFSQLALAVDGYKDIYLDRERPVNIHSIFCGPNLKNLRALKPAYVYTNSEHIEEGTYHYTSRYGNFSYTFKALEGQQPSQILARGLLKAGETNKNKMVKELCIVGKINGLPAQLSKNINKVTLSVNDPEWDLVMVKYAMFGKPAFGEGVYKDQRTIAKHDEHDQKVYVANQAYLANLEQQFEKQFNQIVNQFPKKLEDAIKYAHQEDGFLKTKTYSIIKEPNVWTPIAKERFDTQQRQLGQKKDWDIIIQKNFDWFFDLTGKDNSLISTQLLSPSEMRWVKGSLQKLATVSATFSNGNILELDFLVTSKNVSQGYFETLEEIKHQAMLVRNSPIAQSREPRKPVALPKDNILTVYTPTEKTVIFFSSFREKALGDTYRYQ